MNIIKNIKKSGIISLIIFLLMMLFLLGMTSDISIILLVSLAFLSMLGYGFIHIYLPIKGFDSRLDEIQQSSNWKVFFENGTIESEVMLAKIHKIVEEYIKDISRENSAKIYNKQVQINSLQSQINPHFLYNTLESIRGQALIEGFDEIANMSEALAAFFRYSISQRGNLVTLRDEINNIQNYFSIQEYRFNDRFKLKIQFDENDEEVFDYYLPKLTIQPIVENAIFHGLETTGEKGEVVIDINQTRQRLYITISDNGVGMTTQAVDQINCKLREDISPEEHNKIKSSGIALVNVNKRIELIFGDEYGIKVYSTLGRGTDVEIILPIKKDRSDVLNK